MEDYSANSTNDMREILSVSEVNKTANDFINEAFPPLWVVGEISGFKEYGASGHWYFSLKDSLRDRSSFALFTLSLLALEKRNASPEDLTSLLFF